MFEMTWLAEGGKVAPPPALLKQTRAYAIRVRAWISAVCSSDLQENGSLPSRERGLKYNLTWDVYFVLASLPSRERGLKYAYHQDP